MIFRKFINKYKNSKLKKILKVSAIGLTSFLVKQNVNIAIRQGVVEFVICKLFESYFHQVKSKQKLIK